MSTNDFAIQFGRLVKYWGTDADVTVPDGVTCIGKHAFQFAQLHSVTLPETVTEIESEAFYYANLEHITIQGTIKKVGHLSFPAGKALNLSVYAQIPISAFSKTDQTSVLYHVLRHRDEIRFRPEVWQQDLRFMGRHMLADFDGAGSLCDALRKIPALFQEILAAKAIPYREVDSIIEDLLTKSDPEALAAMLQYKESLRGTPAAKRADAGYSTGR